MFIVFFSAAQPSGLPIVRAVLPSERPECLAVPIKLSANGQTVSVICIVDGGCEAELVIPQDIADQLHIRSYKVS